MRNYAGSWDVCTVGGDFTLLSLYPDLYSAPATACSAAGAPSYATRPCIQRKLLHALQLPRRHTVCSMTSHSHDIDKGEIASLAWSWMQPPRSRSNALKSVFSKKAREG